MGTLTAYALRHRAILLALLALYVFAGILAFQRLPIEAYPDITNVQVQIITLFPEHTAEEVEKMVTIPIENQMNGIPKRASMRSISLFGLSQVTVVFEDGADSQFVRNQASQALVAVNLPTGANASLSPDSTPVDEIHRYTLTAPPGYPLVELKALEDWVVDRTLHTVRHNMIEGIALVLLVLVLFLGVGNYRSALVVAAVVPLSLLGAFLLLDLRGIPANLISMGAIDFGIIVDSAVVVIENLLRLLETRRGSFRTLSEAIIESVHQMGRPILFSKAILLTAFVPLYTLQRGEGKIFRPMALTLTFALIAGTVLALTVVPVLASFAVKNKIAEHESFIVHALLRVYRPALAWVTKARWLVLGIAVASLAVTGVVLHFTGSEFLPKLDEGSLWVRGFMPDTITPSEAARIVQQVRAIIASFPETKVVVSQLGRPDDGTDINGFDVVECGVELKPRSEWTTAQTREALCEAMNRKLSVIPGAQFQFSQMIEDNVNEAISGIKSELSVKIFGEDPEKLQSIASQIVDIIKKVPGATDVGTDELLGQPQVQIAADREAIARSGLSVNDVQSVVETALGGAVATQVHEGERTFDLVVKMMPEAVADLDSIRRIPVFGSNNERLTLAALTSVDVPPGFSRIEREENSRRTAVKLSVRGRDLGSFVAEAQQKVNAEVKLPTGYRLEWTGSFENQQRAVRRLAIIVPITLIAIYFLLFTAFDSGKLAFLILLNVPFAAVGGVIALPIAGLALSVSALVGFIALFGVSVQNGVLLVERIRVLRGRGFEMAHAIREGAMSRVRPVVMTAAMAALGLLPAALSHEVGAETSRPFATVIIGGLVTATLLTLFIVPILYPWFEGAANDASPTDPPP